jgi:hypothetical protein
MKKIPLTQGLYALVDDEDFEYLNQWKWYAAKQGNDFYAFRQEYFPSLKKQKTVRMHREVMSDDERDLDHIDGNGLNNQKINLRFCSHRQNHQNRKHHKNTSSPYKGVSWHYSGKWKSQIMVNGKVVHIGLFTSGEEAALAYDKAAKESFGEFARLNFSDMGEVVNG